VEKITAKTLVWASRPLSYAGRLVLINSVSFGMFSFWAQVFILPQEVITQVTKICRNFLWGGNEYYKRPPHVAWDRVCTPKKQGGLGVKNLNMWNMAYVAKLVWAIAMKADSL